MAKVETALEVEVISWRIGACVTMAVEVGVRAGAATGPDGAERAGFTAVMDEETVVGLCFTSMGVQTGR